VKLSRPLFLLSILVAPAFGQLDRAELVSARSGRAEAKVGSMVLHADEATLNRDTGELSMRGHVRVILPAREDHSVVRYGSGVILTDQAIGLTADRLTVKNGLLQASGNIVVLPTDPELPKVQLRGDEMYMYLKIGDATLRGNVKTVGFDPPVGIQRETKMFFPPEIIK
jgi:lipopolysaccharide export system protein LptA